MYILTILKLLFTHQCYLRLTSKARKYIIKILAKYIQIKTFFNKTTLAIDRLIKYIESYFFFVLGRNQIIFQNNIK